VRYRPWWPYPAAVLAFVAGWWQKWPCHAAGWPYRPELIFGRSCYSDLPVLYVGRDLAGGQFPYATERSFEYPVITGYLAAATARAVSTPAGYFLLNSLILLVCTLVTVWATIRLTGRVEAGLIVALSPVLAVTGTINWDMVPVMGVSLALLAWTRERPELAGLAVGLGAAAKFYPALLLFALLLSGRWRHFLKALWAATAAWLAVNLPVLLFYPDGWLEFFRLNRSRPADFGSVYYGLELLGIRVPWLNLLAILLFGACLAAIARFAPRDVTVLAFLTVAAFLLTNKVYSPQYALWLLPLAVAAGAPLLNLMVWQLAELAYWWAVWRHLAGTISPAGYAAFIGLRVVAAVLLSVVLLTRHDGGKRAPAW